MKEKLQNILNQSYFETINYFEGIEFTLKEDIIELERFQENFPV